MTKQEAKILASTAGLRFREMIDEFCGGNQKEFSKMTGIGESSITGYLSYANVPSSQTGFKVYDAFGINPMWAIGYHVSAVNTGHKKRPQKERIPLGLVLFLLIEPPLKSLASFLSENPV